MRNNTGIFNSKSYLNEYVSDLRGARVAQGVRMNVTLADLETLAMVVAAKYEIAVFHGDAVRAREHEKQVGLVTRYIDQMAETGVQ